jgi:hypothetical protein
MKQFMLCLSLLVAFSIKETAAFTPPSFHPSTTRTARQNYSQLFASDKDISSMRVKEIKDELDSLNVSYKDCFDKDSLANKLRQARAGEIKGGASSSSSSKAKSSSSSSSSKNNSDEPVAVKAELFMDFDPSTYGKKSSKPKGNVIDAIIEE